MPYLELALRQSHRQFGKVEMCTLWTEAAVVAAALVAKFQDPPPGTDPLAATHDTLASLAELGLMELQ